MGTGLRSWWVLFPSGHGHSKRIPNLVLTLGSEQQTLSDCEFPPKRIFASPFPLPALHIPAVISHPWLSGAEPEGTSQWEPNNCGDQRFTSTACPGAECPPGDRGTGTGTGTGPGCSKTALWEPGCGKHSKNPCENKCANQTCPS